MVRVFGEGTKYYTDNMKVNPGEIEYILGTSRKTYAQQFGTFLEL
jgi:hypothetical protein